MASRSLSESGKFSAAVRGGLRRRLLNCMDGPVPLASSFAGIQNQSSGDASTSPVVLCERARRPLDLSGDGSLHGTEEHRP
jgi:hypothetical protein